MTDMPNRINTLEEFDRFCRFIDGMNMGGFVENDFMSKKIQAAIRADLAEKHAPDDAEVREASKYITSLMLYRQRTVNSFPPEMVGAIETLIRAAENSVKQNPDGHTQPVLQPVGELQEAIDRALGKVEYEIKPFSGYQLQKEDLDIIIRAAQSQK